jgi:hypothetical protein
MIFPPIFDHEKLDVCQLEPGNEMLVRLEAFQKLVA